MEIRKPKIKSLPYDEWKDNDTLSKMASELNDGGTNLVLGNLDQLINGDVVTLSGHLPLQHHVVVLSLCLLDVRVMTSHVLVLR